MQLKGSWLRGLAKHVLRAWLAPSCLLLPRSRFAILTVTQGARSALRLLNFSGTAMLAGCARVNRNP